MTDIIGLIIRTMVFVGVIINLFVWITWKNKKAYTIAPMSFSLHALIFLILSYFNLIPRDIFVIWRDLISLHGLIILITSGAILKQILGGKK